MDLTQEAGRPGDTALMGHTVADESVGVDVKQRAAGRLWATRWNEPVWNFAILRAAAVVGVHRIWRSGKTHGRIARARDAMYAAFAKETNSMATTGEEPLAARTLWNRLEHMVKTSTAAEDYKKNMTNTEWEAFLKSGIVRKGEPGHKKWAALHEYCNIQGWLPAGEDDPRYPKCQDILERAQGAHESLKDLCAAHRVMMDLKDGKKMAAAVAADKTTKKDTDGLALER